MNIGIIRYIVEVEDRVKDSIRVRDKIEASRESKHIKSLLRIMMIDEIDTKEMINVSSCG